MRDDCNLRWLMFLVMSIVFALAGSFLALYTVIDSKSKFTIIGAPVIIVTCNGVVLDTPLFLFKQDTNYLYTAREDQNGIIIDKKQCSYKETGVIQQFKVSN